jgi:hypothetical protein
MFSSFLRTIVCVSLVCFALPSVSFASFVATQSGSLSTTAPLRILVIGEPGDLGKLLVDAALTKAKLYADYDRHSQIVFIGINQDESYVNQRGYRTVRSNRNLLGSPDIARVIRESRSVKSFDIYTHANVISGLSLDRNRTTRNYLSRGDAVWTALRSKKLPETFVQLHGCTTGINYAPWIAENVGVVALGSLSGTNFQYIYSNAFWSFDYQMPGAPRSVTSTLGVDDTRNCRRGECNRMKPDNAVYRGYWGQWTDGGWPTYKIFCNERDMRSCQRGAVEAVRTFPSIVPVNDVRTLEDFTNVAKDFLCPDAQHPERQQTCRRELARSFSNPRSTYSPFRGTTLNCTLRNCNVEFVCSQRDIQRNPRNCAIRNLSTAPHNAFVSEFRFLIDAFKAVERL